jgi:protein tyrosine/serine phosphatase
VQRETILADYALTNEAVDLEQFALKHRAARLGLSAGDHPILKIPLDVRKATLGAEAAYLSAALERIELDYQSIDNYLNELFGVTTDMQRHIRSLLLTP